MWDVLSGVAKMAWDVMSGVTKTAWDVMSGVTKIAWDVLSGVANLCGMFCPGWQKMAWDVLSWDVLSGSHPQHMFWLRNKKIIFLVHTLKLILTMPNILFMWACTPPKFLIKLTCRVPVLVIIVKQSGKHC